MAKARHRSRIALPAILAATHLASAYTLTPRWGHAATYMSSPPSILIQGGKTDTSGQTYSSAADTADTILISLNASFSTSSPPSTHVSISDAPSTAFHTLSALDNGGATYSLLSFGGDSEADAATQTGSDSSWFATVDLERGSGTWKHEDNSWGSQPMRRLYHSAAGPGSDGKVFITGGVKADGSGQAFADVYSYDMASSTFNSFPSLPKALYHHSSVLLSNGTLIVLGGVEISSETGNPAVVALTTLYVLNTKSSSSAWDTKTISGGPTTGRRGASLVLYSSGDKALFFGGGNEALDTAFSDSWLIDFSTGSWSQISASSGQYGGAYSGILTGPSARFDHSAVSIGNDQVFIFGGYAGDKAADASVYIWDGPSATWETAFSVSSTASTAGVAQAGTALPTGSQATSTGAGGSDRTGQAKTDGLGTFSPTTSGTGASESASPTDKYHQDGKDGGVLTTPARIALIVCGIAIGSVVLLGLLYRYRRRQRQRARYGTWGAPMSSRDRPFRKGEKGAEALIEKSESRPAEATTNIWGLGPFTTRVVDSLSSTLSRGSKRDPYSPLEDEVIRNVHNVGPNPTRNVGNGIRLVGPRPAPRSKHTPAPLRISTSMSSNRSSRSSVRSFRRNMLHDEDSRKFSPIEEEDWTKSEDDEEAPWSSARSILGHDNDQDPFDDGEDLFTLPIRGGPVPTPHDSMYNLDPIDESNGRRYHEPLGENDRRRSTDLLDENHKRRTSTYDELLPLPPGYTEDSMPRSARSGLSFGSMTDAEEGTVERARIVSPSRATLFSSVESSSAVEPAPQVQRRESLFKRVAREGIGSFLYRSGSTNVAARFLDIRDPTPAPALFPLDTDGERSGASSLSVSGPRFPPTAFKGLNDVSPSHSHGPSLSSIHSARSMRDMVIIQLESTDEPSETGIIGSTSDMESEAASMRTFDHGSLSSRRPASAQSIVAGPGESSSEQGSSCFTTASEGQSLEVPGTPLTTDAPELFITPPTLRHVDKPSRTASPSSGISTTSTPQHVSEPPSGSPLPNALLSHRRPVREVVNSINKRGGGLPSGLSASTPPTPLGSSFSSSGSSVSPEKKRPVTMYEAVKREKLMIANPDKKKGTLERKSTD